MVAWMTSTWQSISTLFQSPENKALLLQSRENNVKNLPFHFPTTSFQRVAINVESITAILPMGLQDAS